MSWGDTVLPIPQFDSRGLLPAFTGTDPTSGDRSPYIASMPEFVTRFGNTDHRRMLIRNLIQYRALIENGGFAHGFQMLNGSFVENVEQVEGRAPGDIDVLSLISIPQQYHADPTLWQTSGFPFWRDEIANQPLNKQRFSLDTYAIVYPNAGAQGLKELFYWHGLFGHQRTTFSWKGFVMISFDSAQDQVAAGML